MLKSLALAAALVAAVTAAGCAPKPVYETPDVPAMRWDHRPEARQWTLATMNALSSHGAVLAQLTPVDVDQWCPAYREAPIKQRQAFWAGLLSALAKHESWHVPDASGGGGLWLGLLQIDPRTAKGFGCRAQTPSALFDGAQNLACGVRIAASQVAKDNEILGGPGHWRGVARDWAPFRKANKVADMQTWTRSQDYCRIPG